MKAQTAQSLSFAGRSFCFTGRGQVSRGEMMQAVAQRGGTVHKRVTRTTDYLVLGSKGSKRWKHQFCGNKMAAALRMIAAGGGIRIIGEEAFWKGCG